MLAGSGISIGRLFGVELRLDYSWFVIFALVAWMLAGGHFPMMYQGWSTATYWMVGVLTSLVFFASVVAHELAHSTVSRSVGVPVRSITLFIFGGMASLDREPDRPRDELLIAAAGPVASLVLAGLFAALGRLTDPTAPIGAAATWLGWINLSLALFNLIPGFPLDGGRVLRAVVWGATHDLRSATRIAAAVGRVVAFAFIFWGVARVFAGDVAGGVWIVLIGWFLDSAAAQSWRDIALRDLLAGYTVRDVLMTDCPHIPLDATLDAVVDQQVLPSGRRCFPVVEGGALRGLLTLHRIKEVARERWASTRAGDAMIPREELKTVHPEDSLSAVLDRMTTEDVNQFPVMDDGRLVGMVARDGLLRFIQLRTELGARSTRAV